MAFTKEFLQSKLVYDPDTGGFHNAKNGRKLNTRTDVWGYHRSHTYRVKMCRLVWIWHNGDIPTHLQVDHIDGNVANDRIENLRLVTVRQNAQNRPRHREGHLLGAFPSPSEAGTLIRWKGGIRIGEHRITWKEDTAELSHENYVLLNSLIEQGCTDILALKKELYKFRITRGKSALSNYTPPPEWRLNEPDYQI